MTSGFQSTTSRTQGEPATKRPHEEVKSKITKILNSEENSKRKVPNQKHKHFKRIDNNCHIPNLVQAFSYVENSGLNLVFKLAKNLSCMTVIKFN